MQLKLQGFCYLSKKKNSKTCESYGLKIGFELKNRLKLEEKIFNKITKFL